MSEIHCVHCSGRHPGTAAFCPATGQRLQQQASSVVPPQAPAWPPGPGYGVTPPPGYPQQPAAEYGHGPAGHAPAGYGHAPAGHAPAGYGDVPAPYRHAPAGHPAPGYGPAAAGYGDAPAGYGHGPAGQAAGYGHAPAGQAAGYGHGLAGQAAGYGHAPAAYAPAAQAPAAYAHAPAAYAPAAHAPAAHAPAAYGHAPAGHAPAAPAPAGYGHGPAGYGARAAVPPVGSVRHAYPLTIRDASFSGAVALVMKTMPYALARFGVLLAVSITTLIWYVVAFGGWAFGARIHPGVGVVWFLVCCVVYGSVWTLVVRYFLYLLQCGHIAVLTELMTRGNLNLQGKGMFAYGKDVVRSRFGEVTVLFVIDRLVSGVVRTFNRTLDFVGGLLPIPGLSSIVSVVNSILYAATTYVDETIFSYGIARNETNPWASAKDGLIYYAQNSKEILKTAIWIVILEKVITAIVWAIMLVPAFIVTWIMPRSVVALGFWFAFGFAAILAASVRSAFIKPIFLVMIMSKFHVQIENQALNPEWDARLSGLSDKFREIEGKLRGPTPALAPAAAV